jgi:hypothetical protein
MEPNQTRVGVVQMEAAGGKQQAHEVATRSNGRWAGARMSARPV